MSGERLYKVFNKKTGKTIAWFTNSEDLFYMTEWYQDSGIEYVVEEYRLFEKW
mgnify:CR=1 FL=1